MTSAVGVLACWLATGVAAGEIPQRGLLGNWHLDGDFLDASPHRHDGVAIGAPTSVKAAAYLFGGSDGIEVNDLDLSSGSYTVSGCIWTTAPAVKEEWRNWIAKYAGGPARGLTFQLLIGEGRDFDQIAVDANDAGFLVWDGGLGVVIVGADQVNLRDGFVHHVAATYERGSQQLYVDGVLQGSENGTLAEYAGPLPLGDDPVVIGGLNFGPYHHPWIGGIDEVAIYDRVLSDSEIAVLVAEQYRLCLAGLSPAVPPAIESHPTRIRLAEGRVGEITVAVSGQPEPAKQWFFNGTTMRDATNATLLLPVVTRSMEGTYWLVASNRAGQATSGPIAVVVSNVDPQRFVGLSWPGTGGNGLSLESQDRLGLIAAWHTVSNFPPATADQYYVDLTGGAGAFYRLAGTGPVPAIGRAGWVNGWRFTTPAGTRHRIEYTSDSGGWGNWLLLTNLAVASGDQLYLDYDSLADPGRVYRDTVIP